MRPPLGSRSGPNLRHASDPTSRVYLHVPYRRTRRLVLLVAVLACGALGCFVCAYWLFTTRYGHLPPSTRTPSVSLNRSRTVNASQDITPEAPDVPSTALRAPSPDPTTSYPLDITLDSLDEPDARLDMLRLDPSITYLAYLPHSGLHNQRIALENAITLARLLNRTLLVPPARLGAKTLRYVRSSTLARMIQLSDKHQGRRHCAHIPVDVPIPDECTDYIAYTLVPWAWLVDFRPIEAHQTFVRVSNGSATWIEERLGVRPNETLFLSDTEPYEYQFVDTPAREREGDKYLHTIPIDTFVAAPQRLIQLGTLFGSSRLRLRKAENRRVRGEVRRHMVLANAALTLAAEKIEEALGGTYVSAHVRVGDGHFQNGARANVRLVWWKLMRDVLGLDVEMASWLERRVLSEMSQAMGTDGDDRDHDADEDEMDVDDVLGPPEIPPDMASLRVPHPPLPPLTDAFSPQHSCRGRHHTGPSLRRLNVPLFIATDAPKGLDDPLLAPLVRTFPCTFTLASFQAETRHLDELRNGYDGLRLGGYVGPVVDAMVMGRAWGVVGTEGSTFSRYVEDVLWRGVHGWEIVQRGS